MRDFEKDFMTQLETRFPDLLKSLSQPMDAAAEKKLQELATEVSLNFQH